MLGLCSAAVHMPLAYLLAPTLFLGPLYASYLDGTLPGQANFGPMRFGLMEKRNYIIVRDGLAICRSLLSSWAGQT